MKLKFIAFLFSLINLGFFSPVFAQINSFIYQLQNVDHIQLLETDFDIGVVDIDDASFTSEEISDLQAQDKAIVSYLSIGEAENYRDYWIEGNWNENRPDFVGKRNPNWKGNFKVKYWDPEWQNIIFERVDDIANAGYDGVYLDIVDAYYYYEIRGRETAKDEMIEFIKDIAARGRLINPEFIVIPQNAVELTEDESYLSEIDGVGKEDTWFNGNRKKRSTAIEYDLENLDRVVNAGKFVLAIDYPSLQNKKCTFISNAESKNYVPFVSNRALNKIEPVICE